MFNARAMYPPLSATMLVVLFHEMPAKFRVKDVALRPSGVLADP